MAQLYPETDFGPEKIVGIEGECMNDEEHKRRIDKLKNLTKEVYNRIKHKIKELRSGYKATVDKGTKNTGWLTCSNITNKQYAVKLKMKVKRAMANQSMTSMSHKIKQLRLVKWTG